MIHGLDLIPSLLWHPHQGFWNHALMAQLRRRTRTQQQFEKVRYFVVQTDTSIRFLLAILERLATLGPLSLRRIAVIPADITVLYLDLGTHEEAAELAFTIDRILEPSGAAWEAYGFEANQRSHKRAEARFSNRANVKIIHQALTFEVPANRQITLYKDQKRGLGDSLYRKTGESELVACNRLSDFLISNQLLKSNQIRLLRMNIEGAEEDVIQDLVDANLIGQIDGYLGMWDDVYKIDPPRDVQFRRLLRQQGIWSIPFNGRDLSWPLRQKLITYHIHTRIMQALRRLRKGKAREKAFSPNL